MKLKEMAKLGEFAVQILVHGIKAFLQLFFRQLATGVMSGVVIDIRKKDC